jgi:OmpA-OmpF porin, OOP family
MKLKLTLLIAIVCIASSSFAQTKKTKKNVFVAGQKKPALFGISYTLTDFNAPKNFGTSNASTTKIKDMASGASVFYTKGLTPFIDFTAKFNGIFYDYSANFAGKTVKTEMGLELEPTISIRPLKDENIWAPFLSAGIGGGIYSGRMGGYIPIGAGLQLNASNTTYFFLQVQYKWSITPKVFDNNVFYSIGFAQNIGIN